MKHKIKITLTVLYGLVFLNGLGLITSAIFSPKVFIQIFFYNPLLYSFLLLAPISAILAIIFGWKFSEWYFLLGLPALVSILYAFWFLTLIVSGGF